MQWGRVLHLVMSRESMPQTHLARLVLKGVKSGHQSDRASMANLKKEISSYS
jgi:hypothetical protein